MAHGRGRIRPRTRRAKLGQSLKYAATGYEGAVSGWIDHRPREVWDGGRSGRPSSTWGL